MTLITTVTSSRTVEIQTEVGPLTVTRDALRAATRALAGEESCSTTVSVRGRLPGGFRSSVRLDESDVRAMLTSLGWPS